MRCPLRGCAHRLVIATYAAGDAASERTDPDSNQCERYHALTVAKSFSRSVAQLFIATRVAGKARTEPVIVQTESIGDTTWQLFQDPT